MVDTVNNNEAKHRFELEVEGYLAAAYYERSGNVITFEHTEVPVELGGKGVGSRLVKGALDQVRAEGLKVVAQLRLQRFRCRVLNGVREEPVAGAHDCYRYLRRDINVAHTQPSQRL